MSQLLHLGIHGILPYRSLLQDVIVKVDSSAKVHPVPVVPSAVCGPLTSARQTFFLQRAFEIVVQSVSSPDNSSTQTEQRISHSQQLTAFMVSVNDSY